MREQLGEYRYPQELARKKVKINDSCITSCNYQENLLMLQQKKSSMLNEDKKKNVLNELDYYLQRTCKQEGVLRKKDVRLNFLGSNDREVIM